MCSLLLLPPDSPLWGQRVCAGPWEAAACRVPRDKLLRVVMRRQALPLQKEHHP